MASNARPLVVLTLDLIFYLTPYAHLRQSLSGIRESGKRFNLQVNVTRLWGGQESQRLWRFLNGA